MKVNKDLTAAAAANLIVDELHTDVGISGFNLEHDFFFGAAELEIWTMVGQAGILLVQDTDYTLSDIDDLLTTQAGRDVYKAVAIDNVTYQSGDIYFTYQACADFVDADDRYMVTRADGQYWSLNGSGGFDVVVTDDITFKDQYLSAGIPLSESGTTELAGFTATSLVGALNEAATLGGGTEEGGQGTGIDWAEYGPVSNDNYYGTAYGEGVWIAVSNDGVSIRSTDNGLTWIEVAIPTAYWQNLAYGNGVFVTVAETLGNNQVLRSKDLGLTWETVDSSDTTARWRSITYGDGVFYALATQVGEGTTDTMLSKDGGATWTNGGTLPVGDASDATGDIGYGNGVLIATGSSNGKIYRSTDNASTWSDVSFPSFLSLKSTSYGDGTWIIFRTDTSGLNDILRSTNDGLTWNLHSSGIGWFSTGCYGNGVWIALSYEAGAEVVARSIDDGLSWFIVNSNLTPQQQLNQVSYENGVFVASNQTSGTSSRIVRSAPGDLLISESGLSFKDPHLTEEIQLSEAFVDKLVGYRATSIVGALNETSGGINIERDGQAISWTTIEEPMTNNWESVAYGDGIYIAVPNTGFAYAMRSIDDGLTWGAVEIPEASGFQKVAYGNEVFMGVAGSGTVRSIISTDKGLTWSDMGLSSSRFWSGVAYGNGIWVAVNSDAASATDGVEYSTDNGATWTNATTVPENNGWTDVTFGDGYFVAVSYNGTNQVMTSTDGVTWTVQAHAEANTWRGIGFGNGRFIAVSSDGTNRVMWADSSDLTTWTSATPTADTWWTPVYGNGLWIVMTGQIINYSFMYSEDDGLTWIDGTLSSELNNGLTFNPDTGTFIGVNSDTSSNDQITRFETGIKYTSPSNVVIEANPDGLTFLKGNVVFPLSEPINPVLGSMWYESDGPTHRLNIYDPAAGGWSSIDVTYPA